MLWYPPIWDFFRNWHFALCFKRVSDDVDGIQENNTTAETKTDTSETDSSGKGMNNFYPAHDNFSDSRHFFRLLKYPYLY